MRGLLIPYHTLIPYPPTNIPQISHIFPGRIEGRASLLYYSGFYSSTNITAAENESFDIPMDSIQVRKFVDVSNF